MPYLQLKNAREKTNFILLCVYEQLDIKLDSDQNNPTSMWLEESMELGTRAATWTVMLWVKDTLPCNELMLTSGIWDSVARDGRTGPVHPGITWPPCKKVTQKV